MNKARLEAFSDGVFSIVITLLIFDIKVPQIAAPITNAKLWEALGGIAPLIFIYVMTFVVIASLWINHHFLFETFARSVNRQVNLLNLAYLMFVAFIPFSAYLLGEYSTFVPAALIYGINLSGVVLLSMTMAGYIHNHPDLASEAELSPRLLKQARFRAWLSLISFLIGMVTIFIYPTVSLFFYVFPAIFNIIPGSLTAAERLFRFRLD
jgi:uncharacterized membrane protein